MSAQEFSAGLPSREEKPSFLARATAVNVLLLLAMIVPFSVLAFRPPAAEEESQRVRLRDLEAHRDRLVAEESRLRMKSDLIAHDPEYLEFMARDRLQLQKDGEFIFRFED